MTPLVSVVIPSHRPALLAEAIASVHAQTFTDYELLVRFSRDWWPTKITDAAAGALGKYVVLLCDDDLLTPTFLDSTVRIAEEYGTDAHDVVYTDVEQFGDEPRTIRLLPWTLASFHETTPAWITSLIRRELWERLGGFDPAQQYQDYDFYYRCFKAGARVAHLCEPLWRYRIHAGQGQHSMNHAEARALMYAKHPELRAVA